MLDKGKPEDVMPSVKGAQVSHTPSWTFWKLGPPDFLRFLCSRPGILSLLFCPTLFLVPPLTTLLCLQERLPTVPLSGMYNKSGGKVRLTFKLEQDQLWIGTKGTCYRLQPLPVLLPLVPSSTQHLILLLILKSPLCFGCSWLVILLLFLYIYLFT